MKIFKFLILFVLSVNTIYSENLDSVKIQDFYHHKLLLTTSTCSYDKFLGGDAYDLLLENNNFIPNNKEIRLYGIGFCYDEPLSWTDFKMTYIFRYDFSKYTLKSLNDNSKLYESLDIISGEYTISYQFWDYFFVELGGGLNYIKFSTILSKVNDEKKINSKSIFDNSITNLELENNNITDYLISGLGLNFNLFKYKIPIKNIRIGLREIYYLYVMWQSPLSIAGSNQSITDIKLNLKDLEFSQIYVEISF